MKFSFQDTIWGKCIDFLKKINENRIRFGSGLDPVSGLFAEWIRYQDPGSVKTGRILTLIFSGKIPLSEDCPSKLGSVPSRTGRHHPRPSARLSGHEGGFSLCVNGCPTTRRGGLIIYSRGPNLLKMTRTLLPLPSGTLSLSLNSRTCRPYELVEGFPTLRHSYFSHVTGLFLFKTVRYVVKWPR